MCGLCGLFGDGAHWTDPTDPSGQAGAGGALRRRQRQRQVAQANRILAHYRLRVSDWQGRSLLLSAPTGRTELLDNPAGIWAAAERLCGVRIDPLDPALLASLGAAAAGDASAPTGGR